jgi:hypothetical protein
MKRKAINQEQIAREVGAAIETPQGRAVLGQQMLEPFKKGRDYVAIGRQVMYVHHLMQAEPMWYDLDPQFSAVTLSSRGGVPYEEISRTRITLDPFLLAVYPKVHVTDTATARFDILNREQVRAQHELAELEDEKIFTALHYSSLSATDRNPLTSGASGLSRGLLATAFSHIEDYDAPVANVLMRAKQYRDIREWTTEQFDPVTNRELLKTGYVGDMWGAQFRISKKQTLGSINCLADPQFLGVISVRIDLSVMDAPDPTNLYYGWVFYEFLGVAQLVTIGSSEINVTGSYTAS